MATSSSSHYGYPLNFDWKHPWPRAPVPRNEADRLAELARYQIIDSEPDEKFDKLCRIACKEMKCPIAAVSFIDKQKQWFKANSGLTQKQIPRDVALCAHTIMHPKRLLIVEDTLLDERFQHNPLVTRASAVRFYAGVPITTASGLCIGSVFVFDVKSHTNVDAKILLKIAAKVLKYMDERLKGPSPTSTPVGSVPRTQSMSADPHGAAPTQPMGARNANHGNHHNAHGHGHTEQRKHSKSSSSHAHTEQTAGEGARGEKENVVPPPVKSSAAPAAVQPPPPVPVSAESNSNALVPAAAGAAGASSSAIEVANGQAQGGLGNMGSMLMNLLARTTETQQQLAAQQGVMFETLGQHSKQLDGLGQSMSGLEKKFEQVRLKKVAAAKLQQQQQMGKV